MVKPHEAALKQALWSLNGVKEIGTTGHVPGRGTHSTIFAKSLNDDTVLVDNVWVDSTYARSMKLQFIAGRNLQNYVRDSPLTEIVLNESAVRFFDWTPDEALGRHMRCNYAIEACVVVGVVRDYFVNSLHSPIKLLILISTPTSMHSRVMLKVDESLARDPSALNEAWNSLIPNRPNEIS